jgi:phenylalanyl-tRNA synthetase beta chain
MKISYSHIVKHIDSKPNLETLSESLFQLGHEHTIDNNIFDFEFTPNRGDCLSVSGLLRDLAAFYEIDYKYEIYTDEIEHLNLSFENRAQESCPFISFLKIDIEDDIDSYHGDLKSYFSELSVNKNNFFTDISNYISYETGLPTHCYDASKINDPIVLDIVSGSHKFKTLFDKEIELTDKNLVFLKKGEIINLAGVMGGNSTSCNDSTKSVIVECAYFKPQDVIGKTIKYDIQSEAAHKFERGVDPMGQNQALRRLIKIVEEHVTIKNLSLASFNYSNYQKNIVPSNFSLTNKILGIEISEASYTNHLTKLGFIFNSNNIHVPSHRHDIKTQNDIAEEIARVIGYNNIPSKPFSADSIKPASTHLNHIETTIKDALIENGFHEVINFPFSQQKTDKSLNIDNPLDSNREFLRVDLEESLINNLIYNERRQKDSIKLFEFSDVYTKDRKSNKIENKRLLGIISSGRVGKNYRDFSKKIDKAYIQEILKPHTEDSDLSFKYIDRSKYVTKLKNKIIYIEIDISHYDAKKPFSSEKFKQMEYFKTNIKYEPISEFPSSSRDLSFSVSNEESYYKLQDFLLNYKNILLKEVFMFDFFINKEKQEIKIGFRFIFQSKNITITDLKVNEVMEKIIEQSLSIASVKIPGLR